ncbi:MAG: hypothetical protein ACR2NB_00435 [Solirubrobacteraceae bacterium]
MTSERATAYGRVMATIEEIGATKLQPAEIARLRDAADILLLSEDPGAPDARAALGDAEDLTRHLVASDRWTEERAQRLFDDLAECGPGAPVAAYF